MNLYVYFLPLYCNSYTNRRMEETSEPAEHVAVHVVSASPNREQL
jgi:hypothetical protein